MNILFVTSECAPFSKSGGLADVAFSLPPALQQAGDNVEIIVPYYKMTHDNCGDQIQVSVLPYRLELYVNGILSDEEWPCGNHFLQAVPIIDKGCDLQLQTTALSKAQEPSVLGTFQNAEGWKPEENVFVGDCMPYCHDGVYHVLYLKDRHHHHSKWQYGAHQWSHISTSDFQNWNIHPMAVEIDDPTEGSICTGSWIFDGVTHYLFYTVRMCDGSPAKICRSVSQDGFHFEKDRDFSFILSDKYTAPSARSSLSPSWRMPDSPRSRYLNTKLR